MQPNPFPGHCSLASVHPIDANLNMIVDALNHSEAIVVAYVVPLHASTLMPMRLMPSQSTTPPPVAIPSSVSHIADSIVVDDTTICEVIKFIFDAWEWMDSMHNGSLHTSSPVPMQTLGLEILNLEIP